MPRTAANLSMCNTALFFLSNYKIINENIENFEKLCLDQRTAKIWLNVNYNLKSHEQKWPLGGAGTSQDLE